MVSAFRLWSDALFEWSIPHSDHDFFRYEVLFRAAGQDAWVSQGFEDAELRVEGPQQMWLRLQGFGDYAFIIRSCDGDDCRAFTVPVTVHLGPEDASRDPGNHPEGPRADRRAVARAGGLGRAARPACHPRGVPQRRPRPASSSMGRLRPHPRSGRGWSSLRASATIRWR